MVDPEAHRRAMSDLADRYFADQCRRLGAIKDVSKPAARRPAAAPPSAGTRVGNFNPGLKSR